MGGGALNFSYSCFFFEIWKSLWIVQKLSVSRQKLFTYVFLHPGVGLGSATHQSPSQFDSVYDVWILSVFVLGQLIKSLSHFSLKIEIYVWYRMYTVRSSTHSHNITLLLSQSKRKRERERNQSITKATPLPYEWLLITFLEQTKWIFMLWLSIFWACACDTNSAYMQQHTAYLYLL